MALSLIPAGAVALLSVGCATTSTEDHSGIPIAIPLTETDDPLPLSEIVDSLQYIKLETTDESLIGNIDKLFATKERLILLDRDNAESIYLFNLQGEFINKISRMGRGPNEYLSIEDIAVDEDAEQIILWDSQAGKLLIYGFDGTFINAMPFPYYGDDIEYMGNDSVALYCDYAPNKDLFEGDSSANLIIFNLKSRDAEFDLFFDNTKIRQENFMSTINNFSLFRGETLLIPTLTNSIYGISPKGCGEKYYLDFGFPFESEMANYVDRLNPVSAVDAPDTQERANLPFVYNFLSSDNLIYLFYVLGNTYYYGFYYPESNTFKEGARVFQEGDRARIPVDNDIDHTLPFMPIAADSADHFYYVLESYMLEYFKDTENAQVRALIEHSTPDGNPVVVKAYMRRL